MYTTPGFLVRRTCLVPIVLAAAIALGPAQATNSCGSRVTRVVTIDDVRGVFPEFVAILQRTGLINRNRHWFGGESVRQTGVVLDRGPQPRAALGW